MTIAKIGSKALVYHIALPYERGSLDTDLVATFEALNEFNRSIKIVKSYPTDGGKKWFAQDKFKHIYETEIAWEGDEAERLLNLIVNDPDSVYDDGFWIPSLNLLYMLKMSHRYLKNSPHFLKTMQDIKLMEDNGAYIQDDHEEFYKERIKSTYSYGHPKLNQNKQNFFGDDVPYVYDHDTIHKAVKVLDKPAYEYFKPEDSEVMVSKDMWDKLPEFIKLCAVLEEAYVLAIERSIVPFPDVLTHKQAFDMALMKVCTSITSGWFREYAWNNYDEVQKLYNPHFVNKFNAGVASGVVKEMLS